MLVIIDYGVGNLNSIRNMFRKSGINASISGDIEVVRQADKLLLPGMGHFDHCMDKLEASGLKPVIEQKVLREKIPVLGICVGLQMFMASSEEGIRTGLHWIPGKTIGFQKQLMGLDLKVPNMGWHQVKLAKYSRLFEGLESENRFYFAHSFHVEVDNPADKLIETRYGYDFVAGVEYENIIGVQFHPEKSHRFGLRLLNNFATNY